MKDRITAIMCGIAGLLHFDARPVERADLERMSAVLERRGPDDQGLHIDGPLGFAHRRLAILDLSPAGHQPMSNEDGSVWVVYNGQLFGFDETRRRLLERGHRFRSHCDTELLVHLYEERGDDLLAEIDGMFAFAIWDARRKRLLLARDRLGIKPLYYSQHGARFVFASEMSALLALPDWPRAIEATGVVQYLYQSSVPGAASIVRGIHKLPPGHLMAIEGAMSAPRCYFRLPAQTPDDGRSIEQTARDLGERLQQAVRSHLVADVPLGVFLSGGLDSSIITALACDAAPETLHTFSVRFPERGFDEGSAAATVAAALGTRHHELVLEARASQDLISTLAACDEPLAISSAYALGRLAAFARGHVKAVLTGDGADEILGGYPWRHAAGWAAGARTLAMLGARSFLSAEGIGPSWPRQILTRARRYFAAAGEHYAERVLAFTPEEMARLLAPAWRERARTAWNESAIQQQYSATTGCDEVNRRLRVDCATTLADEMLTKVDRMTMAHGLEARVPFLDRAFVEWAFAQPGRVKTGATQGKLVLRRLLIERLPQIAKRPKHGFDLPLAAWLARPSEQALVQDTLEHAPREVFDERSLARLARVGARNRITARQTLNLVVLLQWCRRNNVVW
ncbi:MAG: asparagine synthase (glutamine-hydrolyzing) [Vicinamibacteria bacterium]|jgi:asparagine synthase (glutamine-hydrolysing)|nr:asparagine synthase (glutamine-hydrolyzing) [Vicinamibacteria bacterium]